MEILYLKFVNNQRNKIQNFVKNFLLSFIIEPIKMLLNRVLIYLNPLENRKYLMIVFKI